MRSDDDWWHSIHKEFGITDPGDYSVAGHLGVLWVLFAGLFPKRLRPVVKWPLFVFVLLVFLLAHVLVMPIRLINMLKRRFANLS